MEGEGDGRLPGALETGVHQTFLVCGVVPLGQVRVTVTASRGRLHLDFVDAAPTFKSGDKTKLILVNLTIISIRQLLRRNSP